MVLCEDLVLWGQQRGSWFYGRLGFEGTFGSVRRVTGLDSVRTATGFGSGAVRGLGFVRTATGLLVLWEGLVPREGLVLCEELQGLILWEQ